MRSYDFFDKLLLRVPRFHIAASEQNLQDHLDHPAFRDAIYLASDSLYGELEKRNFQLRASDEKLCYALEKYRRRSCYRSTPFGGFASVSLVRWSSGANKGQLIIAENSFNTRVLHEEQPVGESTCGEELYRVSPCMYAYGNNFRLYESLMQEGRLERVFKLNELNGEDLPGMLLRQQGPFTLKQLKSLLRAEGLVETEAHSFVKELLENTVILKIKKVPVSKSLLLRRKKSRFRKGAGLYAHTSNKTYGFADDNLQALIRDGIHCLEYLIPDRRPGGLAEFKQEFTDIFERREIPLLLALDPEAGIDYGRSAAWCRARPPEAGNQTGPSEWTKVHELLLRKWTGSKGNELPIIRLDAEDLKSLEKNVREHRAPGLMALFSKIPSGIQLHAAGGVSGLNMLGRLTSFDNDLLKMATQISEMEQRSNPDVVFAEIIHDRDEVADKLNRRPVFRNYVIPVVTETAIEPGRVLELNDLYLSVQEGELILRSKRLNKRVVPRLSTSYNYHRNELSIYRFLCDLQDENTQPVLHFSLSSLFPGLPFYPAVFYRDVLLEAASWRISRAAFEALVNLGPGEFVAAFKDLAADLQLPDLFVYEQNDQRLLIRRDRREDVILLFESIKNQEQVLLREYHQDEEGLVRNTQGDIYAHELVAFILNNNTVYKGLGSVPDLQEESRDLFLDEWLYFKVYMHPCGMNIFLLCYFWPYIRDCAMAELCDQWFFIRYHDTSYHLRIRMKARAGKEMLLMDHLRVFLQCSKEMPNIRKVELSTYERELERYATIGISVGESLFCLSSVLVLESLEEINRKDESSSGASIAQVIGADAAYDYLIAGIIHLYFAFKVTGFEDDEIINLSKNIYSRLFNKLNVNKELRIIYDQDYRLLSPALNIRIGSLLSDSPYYQSLAENLKSFNQYEKYKTLVDLNHMHLNRLFANDANYNEALCYYYLYKQCIRLVKGGRDLSGLK